MLLTEDVYGEILSLTVNIPKNALEERGTRVYSRNLLLTRDIDRRGAAFKVQYSSLIYYSI